MLEWMLCAAAIAATAPLIEVSEESQAEFLDFLADWDAAEAALLDGDSAGSWPDPAGANENAKNPSMEMPR